MSIISISDKALIAKYRAVGYSNKEIAEMKEQKQWKSAEHAHSFVNLMHARGAIIEKDTGELKLVD